MHVQSIGCSVEGGETSAATSLGAQGRERTDILELSRGAQGQGQEQGRPGERGGGAWAGQAAGGVAWAWLGAEWRRGPRGRGLGGSGACPGAKAWAEPNGRRVTLAGRGQAGLCPGFQE